MVTPSTLKMWENYRHYGAQAFSGLFAVIPDTVRRYGTPAQRMKRMHTLCGVQYIVTTGELDDPDLEVAGGGQVRVYRYTREHPRAWVATRVVTLADPDEQLEIIKRVEFDPYRDVVVDREVTLADGAGPGTVRVSSATAQRVTLEADSPDGGVLVLADAWYPGWEATVDDRPAPVMRADCAFRAVVVPAGVHTVEFRFRPRPWRIGLLLMCVGLALVVAMAAMGLRRPTVSAAQAPPE